jgi:hypothetical protein
VCDCCGGQRKWSLKRIDDDVKAKERMKSGNMTTIIEVEAHVARNEGKNA